MIALIPEYSEAHRWLYLKESLLDQPDASIPSREAADLFPALKSNEIAWDKLVHHRLLSRAYAFGWQNSIGHPLVSDFSCESKEGPVNRLLETCRDNPSTFKTAVLEQLKNIFVLLDNETEFQGISLEMLIDSPRLSSIQQGKDTIYIQYPPRLSLRWVMPIDQIEDYYYRNKALGYVYSDYDHAPYILLACEMAALKLYGVICVQDGLVANDVATESDRIRKELDKKGFYSEFIALRPMSDYLSV